MAEYFLSIWEGLGSITDIALNENIVPEVLLALPPRLMC